MFLWNKIPIQSKYLNCKWADPCFSEILRNFTVSKVHVNYVKTNTIAQILTVYFEILYLRSFSLSPIQMAHLQFVVSTGFQNRSFYFQDTWPDCCFLIGWNSPMIGSSSLRRELHLISFLLNSLIIILNSFDESII